LTKGEKKMKKNLVQAVVLFIALAVAGLCLVVLPILFADGAIKQVLPIIGASLFTSGLTFFLVKMTHPNR
jgi:hypothetical protein